MASNDLYLLLNSGPLLKEAEQYRRAYIKHSNAKWKIVKSYMNGTAEGYLNNHDGSIYGIIFKGSAPEGWVIAKNKNHDAYRPHKKMKEEMERFNAAGAAPRVMDYLKSLTWPDSVSYKNGKDHSGWFRIGSFFGPLLAWYDTKGPICLCVGDVEAAVKEHRANHKKYSPEKPLRFTTLTKNIIPKGAKVILKEEWDLMEAKHMKKAPK